MRGNICAAAAAAAVDDDAGKELVVAGNFEECALKPR